MPQNNSQIIRHTILNQIIECLFGKHVAQSFQIEDLPSRNSNDLPAFCSYYIYTNKLLLHFNSKQVGNQDDTSRKLANKNLGNLMYI